MTSLADFLREQAEQRRAQSASLEERRREWIDATDRLIQQLEEWLRQADEAGVLTIERRGQANHEEALGAYQTRILDVRLGARYVSIVPVARAVVGAIEAPGGHSDRFQGRVDMTDGRRKYLLYRLIDEQGERWVMVDDRDYRARPLDRASFEAAILDMLR